MNPTSLHTWSVSMYVAALNPVTSQVLIRSWLPVASPPPAIYKAAHNSQEWWLMTVSPALRKWRQENPYTS